MKTDDLLNRFNYHKPDEGKIVVHQLVREACLSLAENLEEYCKDSREKSLAITKIEEAMFWANAAIARY